MSSCLGWVWEWGLLENEYEGSDWGDENILKLDYMMVSHLDKLKVIQLYT